MISLDLEHFRSQLDWLDDDFGPALTKAAAFCLLDQGHASGVPLVVKTNEEEIQVTIRWATKVDPQKAGSLPNDVDITERGAECISLLLAEKLYGFTMFETAQIGTAVDFWMRTNEDDLGFDHGIEVSGIRRASRGNDIKARLDQKTKRILNLGDLGHEYYISIVEFSRPRAAFMKL
jgi:hypothetical protein